MEVKERKKLDAQNRLAFETHVGIIMRQTGVAKAVAMSRAYVDGPGGLNALIVSPAPAKAQAEATK